MEKHKLSKSTFIRGAQCLKSLYLNKKRYFLRDKLSDEQRLKFKRGTDVGNIARELFPGGVNLQAKHPSQYRKAVINTTDAIKNGTGIIYEAGFQYNAVLVFLDVLIKNSDGSYHAVEVKSSKQISETYILDAALQYYVITGSGLNISGFSIAYIDTNYVLGENLDLKSLFKMEDVLQKIRKKQDFIEEQIITEKEIFSYQHSPAIDIGPHCDNPYPCDFKGHCWKNIPEPSVFALASLNTDEKFEFYRDGLVTPEDLIKAGDRLSDNTKEELTSFLTDKVVVNKKILDKIMGGDRKAIYLKISSIIPAIPVIKGTHPYEEIIYMISVKDNDGNVDHEIIENNKAVNSDFFQLIDDHRVFVYGQKLQAKKVLESINIPVENIYDLKEIFEKQWVIHPDLEGDFSYLKVFNIIAKQKFDKENPAKNDLLAADMYAEYLVANDENIIENIRSYNHEFLEGINKLRDYLNKFRN